MRDMSAADLLSAWERALGRPPVHQALVLLEAAYPECPPEQLAGLSIGRRDACLLALHERWFGPALTGVTTCPQCHAPIELAFSVPDIQVTEPVENTVPSEPARAISVRTDGYAVQCRLPTSLDLMSMDRDAADEERAGEPLLRRCILSAVRQADRGEAVAVNLAELPATLVDAIAEGVNAADPQADTRLGLSCPACSHSWHAAFDIATYLVTEVHAWARRQLGEVHDLARAYGWSEAAILAMTPTRRRAYLELLGLA